MVTLILSGVAINSVMGPSGLLEKANKKQNEVEKSQNKDDARIENLEDELAK